MAKILITASLVTQSAPATPSAGFGTLYASGSSLFFKNSSGTNYDLSVVGSSSFTVYTSSGTYTYNTGSGIQYIKVVCVGGGGGGGSSRLGANSTTRTGGGGGAGGSINVAYFSSASLTTGSYTVTVGAGGAGGGERIGASVLNGIPGSTGASSSFASGSTILLRGIGGTFGAAGAAGTGGTGGSNNTIPSTTVVPNPYPPFYHLGANGSQGGAIGAGTSPGSNTTDGFNGSRFLAGGGGGGGITSTNISGSGGSGSAIYNYTNLIRSGSPGIAGGSVNGQNGADVFDIINFVLYYTGSNLTTGVLVGTGGHGGAGGNPSGRGGSGSRAAGGGGGGSSTVNFTASAAGPGGDGFVIIFEYY